MPSPTLTATSPILYGRDQIVSLVGHDLSTGWTPGTPGTPLFLPRGNTGSFPYPVFVGGSGWSFADSSLIVGGVVVAGTLGAVVEIFHPSHDIYGASQGGIDPRTVTHIQFLYYGKSTTNPALVALEIKLNNDSGRALNLLQGDYGINFASETWQTITVPLSAIPHTTPLVNIKRIDFAMPPGKLNTIQLLGSGTWREFGVVAQTITGASVATLTVYGPPDSIEVIDPINGYVHCIIETNEPAAPVLDDGFYDYFSARPGIDAFLPFVWLGHLEPSPSYVLLRSGSELVGTLEAEAYLAASIHSGSELAGVLEAQAYLAASLHSGSELIGLLQDANGKMFASFHSGSELIGTLAAEAYLAASIHSGSELIGTLASDASLAASIHCGSRLVGDISEHAFYRWIDFEPVELAEVGGDEAIVSVGAGATLTQATAAGFPDRHISGGVSKGIRCVFNHDFNGAYLALAQAAPRTALHVRVMAHSNLISGSACILRGVAADDSSVWTVKLFSTGTIIFSIGGHDLQTSTLGLSWRSIEMSIDNDLKHVVLYVDGLKVDETTLGSPVALTETVDAGAIGSESNAVGSVDLDELVIDSAYIGPVRVNPTSSSVADAARWLVLYDATSADSRTWAAAYRAHRSIPHINMVGLTLPLSESAAAALVIDYVTAHGMGSKLRGLVAGYGISHAMVDEVRSEFATDGLNLSVFEFAAPSLAIATALFSRPDAITARVHCGVAISTISSSVDHLRVDTSDWTQASDWASSIDAQQIRLPVTTINHGHAVEVLKTLPTSWTALGTHRAVVAGVSGGDPTDSSGGAGSALVAGYAAVVLASSPGAFSLAAWFGALRAGKSLGEAAWLAGLTGTTRYIADPLGTIPLPLAGYELRSRATKAGDESVVAVTPARVSSFNWLPGANYNGYVRVVGIDAIGQADAWPVRLRRIQTDADGKLLLPLPNAPIGLTVQAIASGRIRVIWSYQGTDAAAAVKNFKVYARNHADAWDFATARATVVATGSASYQTIVGPFDDAVLVDVIVRATSTANAQELNTITRSTLVDASAPDAASEMTLEVSV